MRRPFLLGGCLCLLSLGLLPAQKTGGIAVADREKVSRAIATEMSGKTIPGLSAALVVKGRLVWARGFGLADLENLVPVHEGTVFRLASISKAITAVATMRLSERGKLDLDLPIRRYVPAFPRKRWPVTARQLLGHLGGVRHYKRGSGEIGSTKFYAQLTDGLAIFKDDPLLAKPGTTYKYTTYGYTLLGCALERVAEKDIYQVLKSEVFLIAGMDRTYLDSVQAIIPGRAQGYRFDSPGRLVNSKLCDTSYKIPGGGLCATAGDLARFAIALLQGKLVKAETKAKMFTRQRLTTGKRTKYGLGWNLGTLGKCQEVYHSGGQPRVSNLLYMLPTKGFAFVVLSNREKAKLLPLCRQVARIFVPSTGSTSGATTVKDGDS